MLRFLTAGESHGPALTVIVDGLPAGVPVDRAAIDADLRRRQGGYGRGGRMKIESDAVEVLSRRPPRPDPGQPGRPCSSATGPRELEGRDVARPAAAGGAKARRALKHPRPGHADLAGALKYLTDDLRNVLERASARETTARVAAGALAARPAGRRRASRCAATSVRIGEAAAAAGRADRLGRARGDRGEPRALRRRGRGRGHDRGDRRGQEGGRHGGRRVRGRGARACRPASARSRSGTAGSTAASPRR